MKSNEMGRDQSSSEESSNDFCEESDERGEKKVEYPELQGFIGVFSFMNKCIEEEPETSESPSAKPKQPASDQVVQQVKPAEQAEQQPSKLITFPAQKTAQTAATSSSGLTKALCDDVMIPVELLKVSEEYELTLSRRKRQSKREKNKQKERELVQRQFKHRSQPMEMVFNAVSSYFY